MHLHLQHHIFMRAWHLRFDLQDAASGRSTCEMQALRRQAGSSYISAATTRMRVSTQPIPACLCRFTRSLRKDWTASLAALSSARLLSRSCSLLRSKACASLWACEQHKLFVWLDISWQRAGTRRFPSPALRIVPCNWLLGFDVQAKVSTEMTHMTHSSQKR